MAKEAYIDLWQKEKANLITPSPQLMEEENASLSRLDRMAFLEEKFLKQKSKLHWLQVGDKK